jgi:hypothetical protein
VSLSFKALDLASDQGFIFSHPTSAENQSGVFKVVVVAAEAWSEVASAATETTLDAQLPHLSVFAPYEQPAESGALKVTPSKKYVFGLVPIGETKDRPFKVENTGGAALSGSVALGGDAAFTLQSDAAFTLAAGESKDIMVRFAPTEAVGYTGTVTFTTAGATPIVVDLVAKGYEKAGCFGSGTLDSGSTAPLSGARGDMALFGVLVAGLLAAGFRYGRRQTNR